MTRRRLNVLLFLVGMKIVVEDRLPPGPEIPPEDVGKAGPWYGVQPIAGGNVVGWAKDPQSLLVVAAEKGMAFDDTVKRLIEISDAVEDLVSSVDMIQPAKARRVRAALKGLI